MIIPNSLLAPLFSSLWNFNENAMFLVEIKKDYFKLLSANKAQLKQFNCKIEYVANKNLKEVINTYVSKNETMYSRIESNYNKCIKQQSILTYEEVIVTKKNEQLSLSTTLFPITTKQKITHILGVSRDITAQKTYATLKKKTAINLSKAQAAKTAFLANISHEIITPLNGIVIGLDLLSKSESTDKETINEMKKCAGNLLRQTEDILDFGRLNSESLQLKNETFLLTEIIDQAIKLVQQRFNDSKIIEISTHHSKLPFLLGDAGRIQQIIINFLSNAYKFTDQGKIIISTTHNILPFNRVLVSIEVQDSGIGISQDKINELFKPFHQLNNTSTRTHSGSGLGLAISQKIAQLMDGNISVESSLGQGSSFRFEVLLGYVNNNAKNTIRSSNTHSLINKHVLIVEDNKTNSILLKKMLEQFSLNVTQSSNGKEALSLIINNQFDLIMMDWHMPVMDGLDCTQKIKKQNPKLPIIGITANTDKSAINICKASGMDEVLLKPLRLTELSKCLANFLKPE